MSHSPLEGGSKHASSDSAGEYFRRGVQRDAIPTAVRHASDKARRATNTFPLKDGRKTDFFRAGARQWELVDLAVFGRDPAF